MPIYICIYSSSDIFILLLHCYPLLCLPLTSNNNLMNRTILACFDLKNILFILLWNFINFFFCN